MINLSIETRTLHAELMERLGVREAQRSIGSLDGTFITKTISGREYLYFHHYTPGGGRRTICVGLKSPKLDELVVQHQEGRNEEMEDPIGIRELCAQLKAGRIAVADLPVARIIRELAACSVFKVGGVLVGTHAFGCLGNLLGVRWDETTLGTQDIDIAAERNVSIAVPGLIADIPKTLESLAMGFFPIPQLNRKHPSTSFTIRKSPLRVDLLTPGRHEDEIPFYINRLKAAAQPLKYLDYLIQDPIPGAVINGDAIPVLVPQPLKYGLHKLIVSQVRGPIASAKAHKDLYQAYQILSFFREHYPIEMRDGWRELIGRGREWQKRAEAGVLAMNRTFGVVDALT
jgi:hypothetical protein